MVLALFAIIRESNSDVIVPVSTPTASGLPTTLSDGTDSGSKYFTYSSGTKTCVFNGIIAQTNGLKLFDITDGSLMASYNTVIAHKKSLELHDPMIVYYANYNSISVSLTLQLAGAVYSLTPREQVTVKYTTLTAYSTESYVEPTTNYLFTAGSHDYRRHRRGDITSLATAPVWSALLTGVMWSRTMKPIKPLDTHILVGGDYTFHQMIRKLDMTLTITVTNDVGDGLFKVHRGFFDLADPTIYFVTLSSSDGICKLQYTPGQTTFTKLRPTITTVLNSMSLGLISLESQSVLVGL